MSINKVLSLFYYIEPPVPYKGTPVICMAQHKYKKQYVFIPFSHSLLFIFFILSLPQMNLYALHLRHFLIVLLLIFSKFYGVSGFFCGVHLRWQHSVFLWYLHLYGLKHLPPDKYLLFPDKEKYRKCSLICAV